MQATGDCTAPSFRSGADLTIRKPSIARHRRSQGQPQEKKFDLSLTQATGDCVKPRSHAGPDVSIETLFTARAKHLQSSEYPPGGHRRLLKAPRTTSRAREAVSDGKLHTERSQTSFSTQSLRPSPDTVRFKGCYKRIPLGASKATGDLRRCRGGHRRLPPEALTSGA